MTSQTHLVYFCNFSKLKRFLVTDGLQMILVEPDNKKLGWGVVRYVGFLQVRKLLPSLLIFTPFLIHCLFLGSGGNWRQGRLQIASCYSSFFKKPRQLQTIVHSKIRL